MNSYQVIDIIRGTTVDGPGFRTAIYLAGCRHQCPGCQNPQSWNPDAGVKMTLEEILDVIRTEDFDVTLTGGDPMYNPDSTFILAKAIKEAGYGIWLYTGYTIEEIKDDRNMKRILPFLDAIVDGKYVDSLRDVDLPFRGSSNQRIILLS